MEKKLNAQRVKINIDGASRGNPGGSGLGVVVYDSHGSEIKRLSEYIGITTNNIAEYTALIYALQEALILRVKNVAVFSDSELLVKQVNGEYIVRNEDLKRLVKQFGHLRRGFCEVSVEFVERENNKTADLLANQAIENHL